MRFIGVGEPASAPGSDWLQARAATGAIGHGLPVTSFLIETRLSANRGLTPRPPIV